MKLLLDSCIPLRLKRTLADAGHDVLHAGDWQSDPGDQEILDRAHAEHRTLITLDKDFGELAVVYGRPHSGILRLFNLSFDSQSELCLRVIAAHGQELASGALITADPDRIRIRPPES